MSKFVVYTGDPHDVGREATVPLFGLHHLHSMFSQIQGAKPCPLDCVTWLEWTITYRPVFI
jgi:hypothetical protein